ESLFIKAQSKIRHAVIHLFCESLLQSITTHSPSLITPYSPVFGNIQLHLGLSVGRVKKYSPNMIRMTRMRPANILDLFASAIFIRVSQLRGFKQVIELSSLQGYS